MFRLTKVLNLKEDVLQKTYGDTLSAPHNGEQHDKAYLRHKRVLVGKEKDGTLLISRFISERDSPSKTCIDMYDFKSRELRTIYTHSSQINVVGCSISEDKSLLGFTIRTDVPSVEVDLYHYSSFIVELSTGQCQALEQTSPFPQKIHFLYGIGERACVHLLLCGQECSILQVFIKISPAGAVGITKIKKTVISKRSTVWFEYDLGRLHLFLLSKPTKGAPDEHIFKFFNLFINKFSPIYEIPLSIVLPHPNKLDLLYPFPYTLGAVQPVMPHLHVVKMAGNAVCLCQQHELDSLCIKVSIFALHLRQRLDFWIPLNNIEGGWAVVCRTRVLFDCIENMLLVYIPGYFLQLIDCGEEHFPCISMTINDRDFSSPLPEDSTIKAQHSPGAQASTVVPFSLRSEDGRVTMLDTHSGVIYEYTFDRGALLRVFDEDSTRLHIQTLHLACIHMQDSELVDQIIIHVCTNNPQALTVELMKEFLLGTPYQEMKALSMDFQLLQLLPVTSSEILEPTQLKKLALYNPSMSTFYGYTNIPGTKVLIGNKEEEWRRRKYPQDKAGSRGVERVNNKESVSVSQFLKSMFSIGSPDDTPVPRLSYSGGGVDEMDPDEGVEECCALPYASFVDALVDYWISQLPNNSRAKLTQWAYNYRDAQISQVKRLYSYIYKSTVSGDMHNTGILFQLLERLYTALEELALPFPPGFHTTFASLGFRCLPRVAFLQFVERGIISLTSTFLRDLLAMPTEDWDFRFQLLMRMQDSSKAIGLIQNSEYTSPHLLIESAISSLYAMQYVVAPTDTEKNEGFSFFDMEVYNNSTFIPLSALLGFVNKPLPLSPKSQSQENVCAFVSTSCAKPMQSFF